MSFSRAFLMLHGVQVDLLAAAFLISSPRCAYKSEDGTEGGDMSVLGADAVEGHQGGFTNVSGKPSELYPIFRLRILFFHFFAV